MTLTDYFSLAWFLLTIFCAVAIKCRDDRIRGLERQRSELEAMAHEACDQRDDYARLCATKDRQIRGHIRDTTMLNLETTVLSREVQRLKRGDDMDADAIIEDLTRWLAQEGAR